MENVSPHPHVDLALGLSNSSPEPIRFSFQDILVVGKIRGEDNVLYVYVIMAAHRTNLVRVEKAEVGKTYLDLASAFTPAGVLVRKEMTRAGDADKPGNRYRLAFRLPNGTMRVLDTHGRHYLDEIRNQSGGRRERRRSRKRKTRRRRKQRKSRKRMRGGAPVVWADVSGNCSHNKYDEETGEVQDSLSLDSIDATDIYKASDGMCYDISNICQSMSSGHANAQLSPISRAPLTEAERDACTAFAAGTFAASTDSPPDRPSLVAPESPPASSLLHGPPPPAPESPDPDGFWEWRGDGWVYGKLGWSGTGWAFRTIPLYSLWRGTQWVYTTVDPDTVGGRRKSRRQQKKKKTRRRTRKQKKRR